MLAVALILVAWSVAALVFGPTSAEPSFVGAAEPSFAFLMALAGMAKGAVSKLAAPLLAKGGAFVGKTIGLGTSLIKKRPVLTAAATGVAVQPILQGGFDRFAGGPPMLPQLSPQGIPVPREGPIGRTISRILPGGRTGREYTPYQGTEIDKAGRPIAVYPDTAERLVAPPGYVIVYPWGQGSEPLAMLKGAARSMGLWKARPKPPVSGWDMRAITRAAGAKKRVKSLAGKVGLKTSLRGR